ncbi:hypothetical protein [Paenibacillus popilliae]|uniref:Uncharacterized protein n=1 Tax=Paenibacillus popilliae TaxID=78057 RepID=A0ABY3AUK6_PAEPP|nr:hypothetical protein [Paenibacillus sp. SDF0028]TQR44278.1 hypothetical protein C7Y44_14100 [Paenibacillus sp. SDF0028]
MDPFKKPLCLLCRVHAIVQLIIQLSSILYIVTQTGVNLNMIEFIITTNLYKKGGTHAHHCASGSSSLKNVPLAQLVHLRIFGGDHQANSTALSTASKKI